MITALIVDDEPLARRRLRELIGGVDWIECVGEAADGGAALNALTSLRPDLAFIDIQMPGLSGLDLLRRIEHAPAVIFTTAFDRYAVAAFELGAIDYLLKPFGRQRFQRALERARPVLEQRKETAPSSPARAVAPHRLFVRDGDRVVPLRVAAIERLEACDDFVLVHAGGRQFRSLATLQTLESRLDPRLFLRVHRSHIVNLDHVAGWEPFDGSRFRIRLRSGATLTASRGRSRLLRRLE